MSKNLKCSSCNSLNNDIAKFCTSCGNKLVVTSVASPTQPSKSFLAPTVSKITVTTTTTTTPTRPVSTIVRPSTTTTTTSPTRPASTIIKPSTTTTTTSTPKSILKPTTTTSSTSPTTSTTSPTIPYKSILKPTPTNPITRPKSHTVSLGSGTSINTSSNKPITTTNTSPSSTTSFVKMAAKNRESLDSQAQRDSKILQGALVAPVVSTPPPTSNKSTLNITKKPTTTTTSTTPTTPTTTTTTTTRPASMSVSVHSTTTPPPKSPNDKAKEVEKLEKQIQLEKEKFQLKEKEIALQRQQQYEKDKQIEREKQMADKEKQVQLEREKEREKESHAERERQKQMERERLKQQEREEKEKQHQERERLKQLEKEEKERQHQERDHQKQLEKEEKERQKQLEKEERDKLKKLEREKYNSSPLMSSTRKDSNGSSSSNHFTSLSNSGSINNNSNSNNNNDEDNSATTDENNNHISNSNSDSFESSTLSMPTTTTSNKKKRDKEKQKSRIFSLFTRGKDGDEDEEELTISSPQPQYGGNNSPSSSPTPDSPCQTSFGGFNDSGDEVSSNGGDGTQLRKWAIKRNELQRSEGNLFAPSSPSTYPLGSHSPSSSSGSLSSISISSQQQTSSFSSFIPSSSPSTTTTTSHSSSGSTTSQFQMGTSRISSPIGPPPLPNNLPQAIEQRDRVIEEIIVTEADYIRDLEIMVWLKKEMTIHDNDVKGNTLDEINSLFSNVEQLLMVNKELYKKFCNFDSSFNPKESTATPTTEETTSPFVDLIASGFVAMADFLKSYFVYCSNQQKALSTFSSLRGKNCTYLAYLLTRRECRSLPFDSFLIKPVQRVCKYPLLIRELIKTTPIDSISYSNLINAQSKIETIVFSVNEKKREFDSQMKMLDIQNRIIESGDNTTKILSPSRKLIKEGLIHSWGSTVPNHDRDFLFKRKNKEGYYYLFNDLFIYAELKSSVISSSSSTALSSNPSSYLPIKVKAEIPFEYSVICDSPLDDCAFELKNKNLWCMFSLETLDEKKSLFTDIENSILSYQTVLHEYQKYVEERLPAGNRQSSCSISSSTAPNNNINSNNNSLSLSSNSLNINNSTGAAASSSSSSSELLSIEEWKLLVRNKPLPALPSSVVSPQSSPSIPRINKALPTPPIPQR